MARKSPPLTPPSDFDESRIIWPVSLAGLLDAWKSIVTPIQAVLRTTRGKGTAQAVRYYSTTAGIAESKIIKIHESELLAPTEEPEQKTAESRGDVQVAPDTLALMCATLESLTKAGRARTCPGHPEKTRGKRGQTVPVVCFNCHAPSTWPGSPEKRADDVKEGQMQEWALSALECIVLTLDAVMDGNPRNASEYAQSAGIATDKLIEGTKRHIASRAYERQVVRQFCSLGIQLAQEDPKDVGVLLGKGGFKKMPEVMKALGALAIAIDARHMSTDDLRPNTMAALSLVLRPPKRFAA